MEIVLGIEKKMSDEGYKSNISRIAGSDAGVYGSCEACGVRHDFITGQQYAVKRAEEALGLGAGIFVCGAERQKDQSCGAARQGLDRGLHLYELYRYLSVVDGGYGEAPRAMDK